MFVSIPVPTWIFDTSYFQKSQSSEQNKTKHTQKFKNYGDVFVTLAETLISLR